MRTDRTRAVGFLLLIAVGAILLAYGGWLHAIEVLVPKEDTKPASPPVLVLPQPLERVAKSEWAVIRDVTLGGLAWDESGRIKQTYTGEAPTAACPT